MQSPQSLNILAADGNQGSNIVKNHTRCLQVSVRNKKQNTRQVFMISHGGPAFTCKKSQACII